MQKLKQRNTYTPTDSPQVRSNCGLPLNKAQRLSVSGLKTRFNNPDVDQPQHREGWTISVKVYVISVGGEVLMPTTPRKARVLLKQGKAKVIKRNPFTIQLTFETTSFIQPITLGIDSGYKNIGFSAVTGDKELISGEVKLDNMMSKRLQDRLMYRRNRRGRLWHREPRFLNRSKSEGWLPPSIQRRYDTHLNLINILKKILPIQKTIIETANFDIQKIMNPEIHGIDYQQGSLYEYQNIRSYLMAREHGKCQLCGKDFKGQPSHIHHCEQRNMAGSNRPKNMAILHKKCHEKLHKKGLKLPKPKSYKPNTFMTIIYKKFYQDVFGLKVAYGYETFIKRNELGLDKSHINDAFVIAGGNGHTRANPLEVIQKRKNNRCLQKNRKGFAPAIRKQRYSIQPKDLVKIENKWIETAGCHCKGTRIMVNKKSISIKLVESVYHVGTLIWRQAIPPRAEAQGFLA